MACPDCNTTEGCGCPGRGPQVQAKAPTQLRYRSYKLTLDDIRAIRLSEKSNFELSSLYGVSDATVHAARIGQTWRRFNRIAPPQAWNEQTRRWDPPVATASTPHTPTADPINHPSHYKAGGLEVIDVIEGFGLGFRLGNAVKYLLRAGKKGDRMEDLKKARWYIDREIEKGSAQ